MEQQDLGLKGNKADVRDNIFSFGDKLIIDTKESVFEIPDSCNIWDATPSYVDFLKKDGRYRPLEHLKNVYRSTEGTIIIIDRDKAFEFCEDLGWSFKQYTNRDSL